MSLRILQICSCYKDALYKNLFKTLKENHDIDSSVYFYAKKGSSYKHDDSNVIYAECYRPNDRFIFTLKENKALFALRDRVRGREFDLIHAHTLFTDGFLAMRQAEKLGIPYVVSVRSTDLDEFFKLRLNLRGVGLRILDNATGVIFISDTLKKKLFDSFIPFDRQAQLERKSHTISNGIASVFLDNEPYSVRGSTNGVIRILQVGLVCRRKNQIDVMKACDLLRSRGYAVSYTVIGRNCSNAIMRRLHSRDYIRIMEPKSQIDLVEEYRNADVFAMPSRHETFGLTYVEAMSQGLPVIYTRREGFDGRYPEGYIGYSVPLGNIEALSQAIVNASRNKQRLAPVCIEEAKYFSWKHSAEKYNNVYRAVAGSGIC